VISKELARIVGGKLFGKENVSIKGFDFDSRKIQEKMVFIPLKGNRDGHLFITDAVKKGAVGYLTERGKIGKSEFFIEVENTLKAFSKIGAFKRKLFKGKVIGITGSVGKTTTKELLNFILSENYNVYSNKESFNNLIGVSYTLSNIPGKAEILIQEIGTNKPGEISQLSETVMPDIGIITAIGESHLEGFNCIENVIEEKLSILKFSTLGIVPSSFKVNSQIPLITFGRNGDVELMKVQKSKNGSYFTLKIKDRYFSGKVNIPGKGILNSIMIAAALTEILDLDTHYVLKKIESFKPPKWRLNIRKLKKGIILINDSYNANPLSMRNAIEVLSLYRNRKIAILGDMLELGKFSEEKHREVGKLIPHCGIETLITFGNSSKLYGTSLKKRHHHFTDMDELLSFISNFDFENSTVLIKGSRGNRLELVAKSLEEIYENSSD
jgi:UDP-N-acetylmuramoyl-tripeptide--D-alanyl-D-alanine ligase